MSVLHENGTTSASVLCSVGFWVQDRTFYGSERPLHCTLHCREVASSAPARTRVPPSACARCLRPRRPCRWNAPGGRLGVKANPVRVPVRLPLPRGGAPRLGLCWWWSLVLAVASVVCGAGLTVDGACLGAGSCGRRRPRHDRWGDRCGWRHLRSSGRHAACGHPGGRLGGAGHGHGRGQGATVHEARRGERFLVVRARCTRRGRWRPRGA